MYLISSLTYLLLFSHLPSPPRHPSALYRNSGSPTVVFLMDTSVFDPEAQLLTTNSRTTGIKLPIAGINDAKNTMLTLCFKEHPALTSANASDPSVKTPHHNNHNLDTITSPRPQCGPQYSLPSLTYLPLTPS